MNINLTIGRCLLAALALALLLLGSAALAQEARAKSTLSLSGQIIVDPDNASWLVYNRDSDGNGKLDPCYLGGPGGPEDFLYRGTRNADGTRTGDQQQIIDAIKGTGANCVYLMAVRTHGGDAGPDKTHNPFVDSDPARGLDEDILNQWEEWFTLMDRHGIAIYFFLYDDSARIWNTGDAVGAAERSFIQGLVNKFKHHKHLIWCIAEEYEEAYGKNSQRIKNMAAQIRATDDHAHVIAVHHAGGDTTMDFPDDPHIDQFAQQARSTSPEQLHAEVLTAFADAAGRFHVNMAENWNDRKDDHASDLVNGRRDRARQRNWACGMAGASFMVVGTWEKTVGVTPPAAWLEDWGRQVRFFEATNFNEMTPRDDLRFAGTQYVLAKPGDSYIAYASNLAGDMGIKGMTAGNYDFQWLDCATGKTAVQKGVNVEAQDQAWARPAEIGKELAVYIKRTPKSNRTPASYFPPPESKGGWRKLDQPEEIRRLAGMDPDKLAELKDWLLKSDERDFAAVVIRNGYIVLEVERGNSAKTDARRVASVSKAICATVLAIASEQSQEGKTPRKMKFDDPAFDFIPWAQPLSDPRKAKITVKQLFNHTSGICPEALKPSSDTTWDKILGHTDDPVAAKLAFDPGTASGYSTHALFHASLVCETVTGKPYDEFAIEMLFNPIGVEKWTFQHFEGGEKIGRHPSHGLGMPARDLARIAYCMLHAGRWQDKQVIPKWFVEETAKPTHDVKTPEMRWGYNADVYSHGWELPARLTEKDENKRRNEGIPDDARYKPGSGGQLMAFVPSLDLVITRQTGSSGQWQYDEYLRRACAAVLSHDPAPTPK